MENEIEKLKRIIAWKEKKIAAMTHVAVSASVNLYHGRNNPDYLYKVYDSIQRIGRKEYKKFIQALNDREK